MARLPVATWNLHRYGGAPYDGSLDSHCAGLPGVQRTLGRRRGECTGMACPVHGCLLVCPAGAQSFAVPDGPRCSGHGWFAEASGYCCRASCLYRDCYWTFTRDGAIPSIPPFAACCGAELAHSPVLHHFGHCRDARAGGKVDDMDSASRLRIGEYRALLIKYGVFAVESVKLRYRN